MLNVSFVLTLVRELKEYYILFHLLENKSSNIKRRRSTAYGPVRTLPAIITASLPNGQFANVMLSRKFYGFCSLDINIQ